MKKNCILLLIDSITFDVVNSKKTCKSLFPNLYYLSSKFLFKKCISNSNCTQFVLPSLFSMTMPLDEGGYDYGIKNRKISIMEILKSEGYDTIIMSNCNQMGADNGYDRGVDENINSFDFRLILEQKISRVILPKYKSLNNSESLDKDKELIKDYKNLIIEIQNKIKNSDKTLWNKKLKKINFHLYEKINKELKLIEINPEIIKKKLNMLNPASMWMFLGISDLGNFLFWIKRILGSVKWRLKFMITKSILPITLLGHQTINIIDFYNTLKNKIRLTKRPFFIYHHIMDLHDNENFGSFKIFFRKILNYPKWFIKTFKSKSKRKFFYDSTLMLVDDYLGKILNNLDDETYLFITSDHAHRKSLRTQIKRSYITTDIFNEMHGEDIEVPLICNKQISDLQNEKNFLIDTIAVSKIILKELEIDFDKYVKVYSNLKKEFVITEHAGRGGFDIKKDLYFTITGIENRMIVVFMNNEIFVKFYNIKEDPNETKDISKFKENAQKMQLMLNYLLSERNLILKEKLKYINKINNNLLVI